MSDKTIEERLDRLEKAVAEHTQGDAVAKGEWQPPGALRSAAGTILCEQRAAELEPVGVRS